MSRTSALGAVEFENETGWAEVSTSFGSRLAVLGEVDCSGLEQAKVPANRTVQYQNDGTMPVRGTLGGSFTTDVWLPGHGVATDSGIPAAQTHETFLGYVLGATTFGGAATTGSGGTASTITTAAANGLTPGQVVFCGVKGDTRADAQAGVVDTHAANSCALLNELPAALSGVDAVASSVMVYPTETPTSVALTSLRMRALTANQQYAMHGCLPQSLTVTGLSPGEIPRASVTWRPSRWEPVSATFPSALSVDQFNPAPCAGGSLFFQAYATNTRQVYACRSFDLSIDLNVTPIMAPGGVDAFQDVIGGVRGPMTITASFIVSAGNASASPTWPGRWDSDSQFYHLLYTLSGAASGRRMAIYMPKVCIVDRKPVQRSQSGVNAEQVTVRAYTGPSSVNAITQSAVRLAFG